MKKGKVIVVDIALAPFRQNRVLDADFARSFPGATVLSTLGKVAADNGWEILTGDLFLSKRPTFQRAVCLSNEATPELGQILRRGAEPGVLISGESPNVAWSFYHNLPHLSEGFRHACLFRGVSTRVHPNTKFHVHYWPMPERPANAAPDFNQRKLLAMVSSFKERIGCNRQRMFSRLMLPVRWAKILWYRSIDSYARFPDLYSKRLEAIQAYADKDEFCLFGRDWDLAQRFVNPIRRSRFANPPRLCQNKMATLTSFLFTLVLENCIFPGYVTEKIFDAMLAGTVPVYLGAPDIEDFVPRDCFVDVRNYSDFQVLWDDISSWSEDRWLESIKVIEAFLESDQYDRFRQETVALKLFTWLTEPKPM